MLKDLFRLATVAGRAVTRLFVLFVLALTSGVATVGVLVASAAGGEARPHPFRGGPQGVFVAVCGFSHSNHDDAIVFPSEHGRSHAHDYFGATTTDAMSTLESLRASATTCNFLGDTAAYWTPALLADGRPVEPLGANVVYAKATREVIQPFPPGLKVIAGNSQARSPQGFDVAFWSCTAPGSTATAAIPACPLGSQLVLHVHFPDCWNGKDLDSVDHKGHMAYSVERRCPVTHPVAVPELRMIVRYASPAGALELSSGGQFSAHADFLNSWDQTQQKKWVNIYLNKRRR